MRMKPAMTLDDAKKLTLGEGQRLKLIAANLAKSNYHQNFYDQSLGPSVGRVVNDVTAEIAGGSMSPKDAADAIEAAFKQGN